MSIYIVPTILAPSDQAVNLRHFSTSKRIFSEPGQFPLTLITPGCELKPSSAVRNTREKKPAKRLVNRESIDKSSSKNLCCHFFYIKNFHTCSKAGATITTVKFCLKYQGALKGLEVRNLLTNIDGFDVEFVVIKQTNCDNEIPTQGYWVLSTYDKSKVLQRIIIINYRIKKNYRKY